MVMEINFLKHRKVYFIFSGILILACLYSLIVFGLNPGIDFTGGSIMEVNYDTERPSSDLIKDELADLDLGEILIQPTDDQGIILRMKDITEDVHQEVLQRMRNLGDLEERRFESIGPTIGMELRRKTGLVITLSLIAIVLYIALAFSKISRPIRSWQYGLAALLALSHDVLIPLGVFAVLGYLYQVQITIPVVVALLMVFGYSVNNTVVVFDRIRENLLKKVGATFEETVNKSLRQTLTRSINTSLTTLFVLVAIFFFGGETLKYFALALILGILAGTYSSLFLASPLLASWLGLRKKKV